jgi:histone-lysine N-methyltransferase SETMAR
MDNASCHNSFSTNTFIENSVFERIKYPPFSPDIAPSDYYLFGRLKQLLQGTEANSDEECKNHIKNALQKIPPQEFLKSLKVWKTKMEKIINSNGEYIL